MRRGLYAIVDVKTLSTAGVAVAPFAERVLAAGALFALQLRAKGVGAQECAVMARELAPMCRRAGVPFYVNDRPDVALVAGADGVHVGADDLPLAEVRAFAPGLLVGTSNHRDEDVIASLGSLASAAAPDYLAYGPVYETSSKRDHAPVTGLEGLRRAAQRCAERGVPLVAIGGITLARAPEVVAHGAAAGAVIAALMADLDRVTETARALHLALGGE